MMYKMKKEIAKTEDKERIDFKKRNRLVDERRVTIV